MCNLCLVYLQYYLLSIGDINWILIIYSYSFNINPIIPYDWITQRKWAHQKHEGFSAVDEKVYKMTTQFWDTIHLVVPVVLDILTLEFTILFFVDGKYFFGDFFLVNCQIDLTLCVCVWICVPLCIYLRILASLQELGTSWDRMVLKKMLMIYMQVNFNSLIRWKWKYIDFSTLKVENKTDS